MATLPMAPALQQQGSCNCFMNLHLRRSVRQS